MYWAESLSSPFNGDVCLSLLYSKEQITSASGIHPTSGSFQVQIKVLFQRNVSNPSGPYCNTWEDRSIYILERYFPVCLMWAPYFPSLRHLKFFFFPQSIIQNVKWALQHQAPYLSPIPIRPICNLLELDVVEAWTS